MAQCLRVSGIGVDGTLVGNATFNPDTYYITINDNTGYFESSSLDFTRRFTLSFTFTNMAATTDTAIIFESSFLKLSLENGVIKIYKNGSLVGSNITPYLGYNTFKIDGWNNPDDLTIMFGRTSATNQVYVGSFTFPSTPETVKFLQGYSGASLSTAALTRPTSWVWIAPYEGYKAVKQVERQYWKREETEQPWTQPVLSANGTIGGNSFACAASSAYNSSYAWKAFDNDLSTDWGSDGTVPLPAYLEWYNPKPLKINKIVYRTGNALGGRIIEYKIQASIDGNNWIDIYNGNNPDSTGNIEVTVNITNSGSYSYWRIYALQGNGGISIANIQEVIITATQLEETITPGTAEDYDFYTTEEVYNCFGNNSILFENSTPGTYTVNIPFTGDYEVTCVGAGGPAAMRGVYDDKGYGWGGGSGGAFKGVFTLAAGSYTVVVGSANNNTTAQSGNTQTLNPSDTTTHDSSIDGVVVCGGGGAGHYNTNYVGAAGAAPVLSLVPVSTVLNTAGNVGVYNSGGKGSAAAAVCAGGTSVYLDYGRGQGCKTSEYAAKRSWINGTNGYVRIRSVM